MRLLPLKLIARRPTTQACILTSCRGREEAIDAANAPTEREIAPDSPERATANRLRMRCWLSLGCRPCLRNITWCLAHPRALQGEQSCGKGLRCSGLPLLCHRRGCRPLEQCPASSRTYRETKISEATQPKRRGTALVSELVSAHEIRKTVRTTGSARTKRTEPSASGHHAPPHQTSLQPQPSNRIVRANAPTTPRAAERAHEIHAALGCLNRAWWLCAGTRSPHKHATVPAHQSRLRFSPTRFGRFLTAPVHFGICDSSRRVPARRLGRWKRPSDSS